MAYSSRRLVGRAASIFLPTLRHLSFGRRGGYGFQRCCTLHLFPDLESDTIRANLTFPVGTPFRTTELAANRIIEAAYHVNEANNGTAFSAISATIGGASRAGGGPGGGTAMTTASHLASMTITLQDEPLRTLSAGELERQWRIATGEIGGVESLSVELL